MASPPAEPVEPASILLVDDRPGNLEALQAILTRPEYRLVLAKSGREALTQILKYDFAVILLDVAMPDMDGFETASLIKQRERSATIPIIFVTASIYDLEHVYKGYSVGAVDYLPKPVEPDIVKAKVSVFVELHRQKTEIRRQSRRLQAVEQRERELVEERAQLDRARQDARYDATFEHAPVGIAQTDLEGRIENANAELARILGTTADKLRGRKLGEFLASEHGTADMDFSAFRKSARDGVVRRQHRCMPCEGGRAVWVSTTISAIPDRSGAPTQLVVRLEDVTEQRWNERTGRFLVDAGRVLLNSLDYNTTLRAVARLAVAGFCDWCVVDLLDDEGELETLAADHADPSLAPIVPRLRDEWKGASEALRTALASGEPQLWTREASREGADDDGTAVLDAASAVIAPLAARGRLFGAITFGSSERGHAYGENDVRTAMELGQRAALAIDNARLFREAEAAVRARDEFLSVAAHELRTPLTPLRLVVQTYRRLLERGTKDEVLDRLPKAFARAERQIDRLAWLVDTLLDVSRLRDGHLRIERTHVDLATVAVDAVERAEEEARVAGSRIVLRAAPTHGWWDRHRLEQVLSNLLGNAIKYGAGKEIEVHVEPGEGSEPGSTARLRVVDHGIGIPDAALERIFEPFERAVSPLTFGGLGLGLYIARQIVEEHGGNIRAESIPGERTEFIVELPVGKPEQPAAEPKPGTEPETTAP